MQFSLKNSPKIHTPKEPILKEMVLAFLVILIPVFYPKIAEADLFSFFTNLGSNKVAAETTLGTPVLNSQNMGLLKAAVNTDPNPHKSNDHVPLALGNALYPEIGPSGTPLEIEEHSNNTEISLYVVREDDTLSGIANMFDVSVNTIVWANDIQRNSPLKEGQTLIILPITGIRHKVIKGQTISGIVKKYNSDLEEVLEYNDLKEDTELKESQIIIIPYAELSIAAPVAKSTTHTVNSASYYIRPIKGGRKTQHLHGNNGVDLADAVGTPIYAAAAGTVIANMNNGGWNGGYGNYVIISHANGTQTLYSHNSENLVKVGQKVKQGDLIAKMGSTGKSTGSHVHFEIRGAKNPF